MSRVFEALSKATEVKPHQQHGDQKANDSPTTEIRAFGVISSREESVTANNGHVSKIPQRVSTTLIKPRSWRERIEELCLGWDLRRYTSYPIVALEERSPAAEQYKILREQIKRLRTELGIRTITITSPVKQDGKTTVAVNLAASIALEYDEKVLLIDADLRAPSIHCYFNLDVSPGLTDYLSSSSILEVKNLVKASHLNNLSVIPAGRPSHFASELLAQGKMLAMLDEIHTRMAGHTIIIDSPPVLATPDPMVLSRHVDGVIVVVRAGRTPKDYLSKALSSLNSNKVLGVVLNGADFGLATKYYYYHSATGRG
jgi:protein-tyrosine kinase